MLTGTEEAVLRITANRLGVSRDSLYKLIDFESGWNPQIKNPNSSAMGLIQFTNATAQRLGYRSSEDLVKKNPTITDQLPLVENYLTPFKPFLTEQKLYMSVFYPAAASWSLNAQLPAAIQSVNPGIKTVGDYVSKVEGRTVTKVGLSVLPIVGIIAFYLYMKGKRK